MIEHAVMMAASTSVCISRHRNNDDNVSVLCTKTAKIQYSNVIMDDSIKTWNIKLYESHTKNQIKYDYTRDRVPMTFLVTEVTAGRLMPTPAHVGIW